MDHADPSGNCIEDLCIVEGLIAWGLANAAELTTAAVVTAEVASGVPSPTSMAESMAGNAARATVNEIKAAQTVSKSEQTVTRYMSAAVANAAKEKGAIPNVGRDGQARPTHVTTDPPTNSAAAAQKKYELPEAPTHRATVARDRVNDLGPTPDGRATTSGGGSQSATSQPIPVKPCEISELCK